ncbi:MAG: 16S rRNA (uracil(1498)-N(3))-methyltransferase [Oscillospiraceae bacterium]|nr:16S rRNA (uracil(1498)-N(3))-methyltransferase [Candidatus Ruminococcus equi]
MWFFADENLTGDTFTFFGENAVHISKSLRMKEGEKLTLCTKDGRRHECEIKSFTKDSVTVDVLSSTICEQEPTVKISLFVSLLKGDKIDDVIQKATELGVYEITLLLTDRCISRPDNKQLEKKLSRWQKIALSSAMQSRRGIIPNVNPCVDIDTLSSMLKNFDNSLVFYECGGEKIGDIIKQDDKTVAIITGSEGGFEESEIEKLQSSGANVATLGKRILRAQTAPIAAISAIMYLTGNFD